MVRIGLARIIFLVVSCLFLVSSTSSLSTRKRKLSTEERKNALHRLKTDPDLPIVFASNSIHLEREEHLNFSYLLYHAYHRLKNRSGKGRVRFDDEVKTPFARDEGSHIIVFAIILNNSVHSATYFYVNEKLKLILKDGKKISLCAETCPEHQFGAEFIKVRKVINPVLKHKDSYETCINLEINFPDGPKSLDALIQSASGIWDGTIWLHVGKIKLEDADPNGFIVECIGYPTAQFFLIANGQLLTMRLPVGWKKVIGSLKNRAKSNKK